MEAGMNWKDYPHLFANGEFKIKHIYFDEEIIEVLDGDMADGVKKYNEQDYTLIARKIEDITDEEIYNFYSDYEILIGQREGEEMSIRDFLYLLIIGVYPFSQSHFGETVIDINTL